MTDQEAVNVLAILTAAWPWADWPDDTVELWLAAITPLDVEDARHAALAAVGQLDRPPSVAWFRGTAKAEAARRQPATPAITEGPDIPVDEDGRQRWLATCRNLLRRPA